jgi:hypothetical protein
MKDTFPGYRKKTDNEIKSLWKKGTICFDANVLLNLYRYSNSTRNAIVELIRKFEKNIWLPHQAALEYNRNRYEVIAAQEKAYKEFIDKISQIERDLQSTSKPPFLSEKVHLSLKKVFKDVNKEVDDSIKKYCDLLKSDPIYDDLTKIFENKISKPFDDENLKNIYKEGETRFEEKIPPGYEDEKNKKGDRKYGDLVLWKQIIEKAKETKKPIIFITDERKTDWWWKIKDGRNMGPRQELVEELMLEAKVEFHMYSSERFLSYGLSFLEEQIDRKALAEIQEMKRNEIEKLRRIKEIERRRFQESRSFEREVSEEVNDYRERLKQIDEQIMGLRHHRHQLEFDSEENPEAHEFSESLRMQQRELSNEKKHLRNRINMLRNKISHSNMGMTSFKEFIEDEKKTKPNNGYS